MNLNRLATRNIAGNAFRSSVVAICALLLAGLTLSATLIMRGAQSSLELAMNRLGADVVVVPQGTEARVESALLMGQPVTVWMPQDTVDQIARVPGVAVASPQLYLSTLSNASCCSVPEMFLVAYDPATDFTIRPWLEDQSVERLRLGESVGGTNIFVPEGEQNIQLYGYHITLLGNLEPTGTGLDRSMFLTFETARDIARVSQTMAVSPLDVPEDRVSAVLVRVAPGQDPEQVAVAILSEVPGVTPIPSPSMFQSSRLQMGSLVGGVLVMLGLTWGLSLLLIGLVFSMAANERRREIGVMRALGATSAEIVRTLVGEAAFLALAGGAAGLGLSALVLFLFQRLIVTATGVPFLFPPVVDLLAETAAGLALALLTVSVAAFVPAFRISRQEPALAMRD